MIGSLKLQLPEKEPVVQSVIGAKECVWVKRKMAVYSRHISQPYTCVYIYSVIQFYDVIVLVASSMYL